ncbi:MAG TPA: efflux transporter outer membrane subunit [Candidatus Aquabacterium excrementipullorum]|nr:efflux transporter outer membrane subunit [Candidatus Aquabacterium excrementipullorum]
MTRSRLFSTASAAAMAAAAMALLTGCASGPAHPPPSPALSEAAATAFKHQAGWQPLSKMAPGAISSATEPWWRVFNDAELDRLMQTASAGNLDIAQATARDRQARALWRQAGAIRSPQLGVSASALRTESSSASGDTTYTAGLQASWALDLWGRLARAQDAASANAQATMADVAAARLSTQLSLAEQYWRLRVIDRQLALLDRTLAAYERSLQLTRHQYDAGLAARADVIQAETQWQTLRARVHDLQLQRALHEHALAVLSGQAPADLSLPVAANALPAVPVAPPQMPSLLLTRRPDVVAAERRVAQANAQIGVAQAAWWPDITLGATAGGSGPRLGSLFSAPWRTWSLGPALAATLLDGGQRRAGVDAAEARYEETVAAYRQAVLTSLREVDDALAALQQLAAKAEQQARLVALAEENERVVSTRYRAGMVGFLEVVVAQNLTLESQRTALDVTAERLVASVRLIAALGGGWQGVPDAAAPASSDGGM